VRLNYVPDSRVVDADAEGHCGHEDVNRTAEKVFENAVHSLQVFRLETLIRPPLRGVSAHGLFVVVRVETEVGHCSVAAQSKGLKEALRRFRRRPINGKFQKCASH